MKIGIEPLLYLIGATGLVSLAAGYLTSSPWLIVIGQTFLGAVGFFCLLGLPLVVFLISTDVFQRMRNWISG